MKARQFITIEREVQVTVQIGAWVNPDGTVEDAVVMDSAMSIKEQVDPDEFGDDLVNEYNETAEV